MARVVVVDGSSAAHAGLLMLLEAAGHDAHEVPLGAPIPAGTDAVIIDARSDIEPYVVRPQPVALPVVVLMIEPQVQDFADVFRRGGSALVPWETPAHHVLASVQAAVDGYSIVPTHVVHRISRNSAPGAVLGTDEVAWLRSLAAGTTVAQLAVASGYAERSMYRLLRDLYERLGVTNRHEAIVVAARRHLL